MQRPRFSTQFKQQIIHECQETGTLSLVARKHDLNDNTLRRWIKQARENNRQLRGNSKGKPTSITREEVRQLHADQEELEAENEEVPHPHS